MRNFEEIEFDKGICRKQLNELDTLLAQNEDLSEQDDILPFFRSRRHLSAHFGTYHVMLSQSNCLAYEFDVLGEFVADLVVGRSPFLDDEKREQKRLNWRAQNVSIAGKLVPILTYDQLAIDFRQSLQMYGTSG